MTEAGGVSGAEIAPGSRTTIPPLVLRGRLYMLALVSLAVTTPAFVILLRHYLRHSPVGWGDGITSGVFGKMGAALLILSAFPVELRADDVGLHWRQVLYRRTFRWAEIESIGVGRRRGYEGYDRGIARFIAPQGAPLMMSPTLGLNLVLDDRNAATVSYRRGFTGYEINLQPVFEVGVTRLAAELQGRLEAARRMA